MRAGLATEIMEKTFLLYEADNRVVAASLNLQGWPRAFVSGKRTHELAAEQIFSWDNLKDPFGRVVGFHFFHAGFSRFEKWPRAAKNFSRSDSELEIYLADCPSYENDCCQAIFAPFYESENDLIILVEQPWDTWKEIGFPIQRENIPQPVF